MKRILLSLLLIVCLSAGLVIPASAAPNMSTSEAGKAFIRDVSGGDQYLAGAESAVNNFMARYGVTLTQQQFDALVDFVVSYDNYILSCGYKVETVIGSGNFNDLQIANAFCSWVKDGDNFSQARLNRRLREIKLFLYNSYDGNTDKVTFRYVVYKGSVAVTRKGAELARVPLAVRVLPFPLPFPYLYPLQSPNPNRNPNLL